MKLNDIINEEEISEIPLGIGGRLKTAAKSLNPFSASGRSQARGQLVTGTNANQIYSQFHNWLGQTGKTANSDTIIEFLEQNGYGQQAVNAAKLVIAKLSPTSTRNTPADTATDTQKLTPDQIALRKKQSQQNINNLKNNPNQQKFKNFVDTGGVNMGVPDDTPSVQRKFRESTINEEVELTKQQIDSIFLAVARAQPPQQIIQPSSEPSSGGALGSADVSGQPSTTVSEPVIDVKKIVDFYKSLPDDASRLALRRQLDQADAALADAKNKAVDQDALVRENTEFSRFLGIAL